MLKQGMTLIACLFAMMLVMGCGGMEGEESIGSTTQELTDPHCTNGGCTPFELDCLSRGKAPMCLNASTDHSVTLCMAVKASSKLMANHPDACRGTCTYPTVCNN